VTIQHRAHAKVTAARKRGLITKGLCEVCSSPDVVGHHENYEKPLDLRWLCDRHHSRYHVRLSSGKVCDLDQYVAAEKTDPQEVTYIPNEEFVLHIGDGTSFTFNSVEFMEDFLRDWNTADTTVHP
jgi:hypothetical protein